MIGDHPNPALAVLFCAIGAMFVLAWVYKKFRE